MKTRKPTDFHLISAKRVIPVTKAQCTSMKFLAFLLALSMVAVLIDGEDYYDYEYGGSECEHENFYCDDHDPSVFHVCFGGNHHTFRCPGSLFFSAKSQTCDWPETADCAGNGDSSGESSSDISHEESSSDSGGHTWSSDETWQEQPATANTGGHLHNGVQADFGEIAANSWINKPANGKAWWRPSNVSPSQWQGAVHMESSVAHDAPQAAPIRKGMKKGPRKGSKSSSAWSPRQSESVNRETSASVQWREGECNPSNCQPPSCQCASTSIPQGLSPSSTPQMVMITFDDEVSAANYGYFQRLFRPGRYNPNGCPVRGCLFVSGSGTVYDLVYPLYAMGLEISSHSVSHRFPHTWWSSASYQEYTEEAAGMRNELSGQAGIPSDQIRGFRVPFLQLGGDNMYSSLYDSKFLYDSSMFTGPQWEGTSDPVWPFTLDYVPSNEYCQHGPCPTKQYPGMWEIPVQRWYGLDGHSCAMPDGCTAMGSEGEVLEYFKSNFRRYYNTNRAPFGIFVHARWFNNEQNLEGLDAFIDYLLTLDDVFIVTPSQVIDWMRKPTSLSSIHSFQPWSCEGGADQSWLR